MPDTIDAPTETRAYPTTKQLVANVLKMLPDDCTMEQVKYHLDVAETVRLRFSRADAILDECGSIEEAVRRGKLIPHAEVMRRAKQLLDK